MEREVAPGFAVNDNNVVTRWPSGFTRAQAQTIVNAIVDIDHEPMTRTEQAFLLLARVPFAGDDRPR